jgi:DNA-binding Xre family transcriptional regulator
MKWNLRLAAANRGIWKASELQRMLAEHGLVISAGKMSGLWPGIPNVVKLRDLDVICAVLDCGVDELLVPEPETITSSPSEGSEKPRRSARPGRSSRVPAPAGRCRPGELPVLPHRAAGLESPRPHVLQQQMRGAGVVLPRLTRQPVPTLNGTSAEGVARGGYVLADADGELRIMLMASGSEVQIAVEARGFIGLGSMGTPMGRTARRSVRGQRRRLAATALFQVVSGRSVTTNSVKKEAGIGAHSDGHRSAC